MATLAIFLFFLLVSTNLWSTVASQQTHQVTVPTYIILGPNGDSEECCDDHPEWKSIMDDLTNPTRLRLLTENCEQPAVDTAAPTEPATTDSPSSTVPSNEDTAVALVETNSEYPSITKPSTEATPATLSLVETTTDFPSVPQTQHTTSQPVETSSPPNGCGGPGWRRVVFLNITNPTTSCPPGYNLTSFSKRTCGRSSIYVNPLFLCESTTFSTGVIPYSKVCGRIRAYMSITAYGFSTFFTDIEDAYISGFSLTHGSPGSRQHIWTFSTAVKDAAFFFGCPCEDRRVDPSHFFVGTDYFCESVDREHTNTFYPDNPLWDGQGCPDEHTCPCEFNNPPWFTKTLSSPTIDDIELRHCCTSSSTGGVHCSIPFDLVELYVQ